MKTFEEIRNILQN